MNLKKSYKILLITVWTMTAEAQSIHFGHLSGVDGSKRDVHRRTIAANLQAPNMMRE
jgi:hypothetical protein